jgi:DNA-directed RNA polymerase specialized sigma24 family protein
MRQFLAQSTPVVLKNLDNITANSPPRGFRCNSTAPRVWRTTPRKEQAVEHALATMDRAQPGEPFALATPHAWPATAPPQTSFDERDPSESPHRATILPLPFDPLDLFRRAIVESDQLAWNALYAQYQRLVRTWLRRHTAAALVGEADDYLVNRTFERFWLYVKPDRFNSFAGLSALLQYLKLCAHGVLLDEARAQSRRQALPGSGHEQPSAFEEVIEQEAAITLWQLVETEAHDESELTIATLSFIHGLKPREIYEQHPDRYASIDEVYRIKRNLLDRLRRDELIRLSWA